MYCGYDPNASHISQKQLHFPSPLKKLRKLLVQSTFTLWERGGSSLKIHNIIHSLKLRKKKPQNVIIPWPRERELLNPCMRFYTTMSGLANNWSIVKEFIVCFLLKVEWTTYILIKFFSLRKNLGIKFYSKELLNMNFLKI